jgi:hypothetical protein
LGETNPTPGDQPILFHGDWNRSGTGHTACIVDWIGQVIVRLVARHDVSRLSDLLARFRRVAAPAVLPIAVGWPSGRIGAALVEAGQRARIKPEVLKSCRPH